MHEVWLILSIAYELALSALPLVVVGIGSWLALLWAARNGLSLRHVPLALGAGLLAAVMAFLAVPPLTGASLADMAHWLDWATLAGLSLGFGAVVALMAWPLISLLRQPALPVLPLRRLHHRPMPARRSAAAGHAGPSLRVPQPGRRRSSASH
ncbi:MAG: hypothetical protein MUP33_02890 [Polaromonas sp.]|nr:hypothetical protein [Polaromonas sp.]